MTNQSSLLWLLLIILTITIILSVLKMPKHFYDYRLLSKDIREIDRMDGHQFGVFLEVVFAKLGYQANRTPDSNDFGADVVLNGKGGRIVLQAKRYGKGHSVGTQAVQEVFAAKAYYQAKRACVWTNSRYTAHAVKLAQAIGVELYDRKRLDQLIQRVNPSPTAQTICQTVEPSGRKCPVCGKPMVLRKGKYNERFFGCSGFPQCRHTERINEDDKTKKKLVTRTNG